MLPEKSAWLYILMLTMLIFGACNVVLKDYMVNAHVPVGLNGPVQDFDHPLLWSLLMKAGMALCLPFHFEWPQAPMRIFVFSCTLGFVTDVLVNMAFCSIAGSAIQMLRGGKVIFTTLLSVAVLKRQVYSHQMIGAVTVILGLVLVGTSTQLHPRATGNWSPALLCCLCSELLQAILWVYQEYVLREYSIPPLQLVGLEGAIGIVLGSGVAIGGHILNVENVAVPLRQLTQSSHLLACVALLLVSMALFNFAGVGVTKYGSAVARSIVDASRSVLIWAVELWCGWHVFSSTQFCGFLVLVLGASIYNRIVDVPYCSYEVDAERSALQKQPKRPSCTFTPAPSLGNAV